MTFAVIWIAAIVSYSCKEKTKIDQNLTSFSPDREKDKLTNADYVGSESCKSCHEIEYNDWKGSHHERAMMEADETSVLADFNTSFTNQGVTSRLGR